MQMNTAQIKGTPGRRTGIELGRGEGGRLELAKRGGHGPAHVSQLDSTFTSNVPAAECGPWGNELGALKPNPKRRSTLKPPYRGVFHKGW